MERGPDGISCIFFCHDGEGNFVMHKRSQNCRDERGNWEAGGGAIKFGEQTEEAVTREIMEEYGTRPLDLKFIGYRDVLREINGAQTHWVALLWVARVNREEVKIGEPDKMDEIGWFQKDNLPSPLHSQFMGFFEEVEKANREIIDQVLKSPLIDINK
jgi:8-oxo-dGTP diphosphatase